MILKSLLFGTLGLASVPNQVTAQYINHLQKYYNILPESPNFPPERRIFDTKAITRVDDNNDDTLPQWTFVSTASNQDPHLAGLTTMVVTRLKPNLPNAQAFNFDKAIEYIVGTSPNDKLKAIDVNDIVHEKNKGYIACGKVTTVNGQSKGFLLKINENLNPGGAAYYPEVEVFESCGWHHNKKGFVAVGASPTNDPKKVGRQAIFLSVKKNLKKKLCGFNVTGTFPEYNPSPDFYKIDNIFNNVVRYDKKNLKLHAMVGTTSGQNFNQNDPRCGQDKDVLVMIADEKCKKQTVRLRQYGDQSIPSAFQELLEEGFALSAFAEGEPEGLVVTGKTSLEFQCGGFKEWDDTLVFRVDDNLNVNWANRYDNYFPQTQGSDTQDFGTAILMNDQGFALYEEPDLKEPPNILVAGQTLTDLFASPVAGGIQYTEDAFVMSLKPSNGIVLKNEIMGLEFDVPNGVLRPGGKLDMQLSQDGHAVVMGNAKVRSLNTQVSFIPTRPYLLERYDVISDDEDQTRKCSVERNIEAQDIFFPISKAEFKKMKPTNINFKVEKPERFFKYETPCQKVDLPGVIIDDIFPVDDIIGPADDIIGPADDIIFPVDDIIGPADDIIVVPDDVIIIGPKESASF